MTVSFPLTHNGPPIGSIPGRRSTSKTRGWSIMVIIHTDTRDGIIIWHYGYLQVFIIQGFQIPI